MAGWQQNGGVYSYSTRQRRCKADWAGIGIGDAFKTHLDYYRRLPAQRAFYQTVRKAQVAVARHAGWHGDEPYAPKVKPQISPFYTNYPSGLAAHAAIGLTAFLELKASLDRPLLASYLADFLESPTQPWETSAHPDLYHHAAHRTVEIVQERLLMEDLNSVGGLPAMEVYRLFICAQQDFRTTNLDEILRAVIHFGDVLPPLGLMAMHPTTRRILGNLAGVSRPYYPRLTDNRLDVLIQVGREWVQDIFRVLVQYLPSEAEAQTDPDKIGQLQDDAGPAAGIGRLAPRESQPGATRPETNDSGEVAPLDAPMPPHLFSMPDVALRSLHAIMQRWLERREKNQEQAEPGLDPDTQGILDDFAATMEEAANQERNWEDMRSDLVERAIALSAFSNGPLEGAPTDGNEVVLSLGGKLNTAGEIYDRPLDLSVDQAAVSQLLEQARPITTLLRRNLYPNIEQVPESLRLRTSGCLDSGRLPLAAVSAAVFRRFRTMEKADRRGKPLLVIACDGSGSLGRDQMRLLKVLAAAWLGSTVGSGIQVMAALYHSGGVRQGINAPLVQWIYHPQKTPAVSRGDAVRALVSLPESGTGIQSDALSLAFIMAEAKRLARGGMVYLTLLSDTKWNQSFGGSQSGKEEVALLFQDLREEFGPKLHSLLVALGDADREDYEDIFDKEIAVSDKELEDYATVAERIGAYVASRICDQRRKLAQA